MTPERRRYAKRMSELFNRFPFVCEECQMPFNNGRKLAQHVQAVHATKQIPAFTEKDKAWLKSIRIDPES